MKRAISELKKVVKQLTEKLQPFQAAVETCIENNDFEGAKKAIESKKVEQVKIDTLKNVIKQLEDDLGVVEPSDRQKNGTGGVAPEADAKSETPAKK